MITSDIIKVTPLENEQPMNLGMARQCFYREINQPDEQIDLAKAALYIAQEEYPEMEIEPYCHALDTMAEQVKERLPSERYPLRVVQAINRYLYQDLGFAGNLVDYYDPRNSFFNQVIDRRMGIPITLSLVYLEIAKRLDFPMVGIGMPGHFLIRPEFEGAGIYIDAFNGGEILFEEDCEQRLSQIYGRPVKLQPELLAPVNRQRFLIRILSNLKIIYLNQGNLLKVLSIVERLLLLQPDAPIELRDRGLLYYQMGRWHEACNDLLAYLNYAPTAEDAKAIRQLLSQLNGE